MNDNHRIVINTVVLELNKPMVKTEETNLNIWFKVCLHANSLRDQEK